jgi:hypothetical protein
MRKDTTLEKNKVYDFNEIIDYKTNSIVLKTLINKPCGNIRVLTMDAGELLIEKISPFDTLIHVIDGIAEIIVDDESLHVKINQCSIIKAHSRITIKANERFKMVSTIVKSGYESVIL